MQDLIAKARQLAEKVHRGQVDKAGKDYIHHPETVASFVFKDEEKVVAWLHDTVEDTDVTLDYIRAEFGDVIAEAVNHVTHRPGEEWGDYIDRVKQNPLSREVKLADLTHNMDITRLQNEEENVVILFEEYDSSFDGSDFDYYYTIKGKNKEKLFSVLCFTEGENLGDKLIEKFGENFGQYKFEAFCSENKIHGGIYVHEDYPGGVRRHDRF